MLTVDPSPSLAQLSPSIDVERKKTVQAACDKAYGNVGYAPDLKTKRDKTAWYKGGGQLVFLFLGPYFFLMPTLVSVNTPDRSESAHAAMPCSSPTVC